MTFHFPDQVDTNQLTIDATDPKSGTAEFKAAAIRVEKIEPAEHEERAAIAEPATVGASRSAPSWDVRPDSPVGDWRSLSRDRPDHSPAWGASSRNSWGRGTSGSPSRPRRRADAAPRARRSTPCSAPRSTAGTAARVSTVPQGNTASSGHAARARRHLLLPALWALQERIGWISPGGLNELCRRLTLPPADVYGVATFYAMLAVEPRPATGRPRLRGHRLQVHRL